MSHKESLSARRMRFMHRLHARLSTRARPATGIVSQPEPRSIGSFAKGRQMSAGNILFAGHLVEARGAMLWDISAPDSAFAAEAHGFGWLDDLAAAGDAEARAVAQAWTWGWIEHYGRGTGPGWVPDLTGRRIIRWIHHAIFMLRGQEAPASDAFYRSLAQQAIFLSRRWQTALPGLPRIEALTGMLYAGISLTGMERMVAPALAGLARLGAGEIDAEGGIATRNPEELLEVFTLLTWAQTALEENRHPIPEPMQAAIARIAPTLRALRHSDGGLARFHGGGRGLEGRLDSALALSGNKTRQTEGLAMGYARLSAGRTSVIIDAAAPPSGLASAGAHASTLAFELTSARRPVIVNCGSGARFGVAWRKAGRATPSHSTLCLEGYSSSRFGTGSHIGGAERELLEDIPHHVPVELSTAPDGLCFEGGHDGYVRTHGLTHARRLELTSDGRALVGEDMLMALDEAAVGQFDRALSDSGLNGLEYRIRLHLHPDTDAEMDMGGMAVSIALRSGEVWVFRHEPGCEMTLEPSVYLESGRLRPRAAQQIVLSGRLREPQHRVRWSLSKTGAGGEAIRDLALEDATD